MRTASSLGGIGCSRETKEGFPEVVSPALSLKDNRKLSERAEKGRLGKESNLCKGSVKINATQMRTSRGYLE